VLALLAVLLVVFPASAIAVWLAGGYLVDRRPGATRASDSDLGSADVASLAELELAGYASNGDIISLTPRERQFVARTVGPRLAGGHEPRAARDLGGRRPVADREVPVAAFHLVCPACGASLGTAADVAHYVGSCPACSRRVASRRRGSRISLAAVETISRPGRRPRG
jgi:hypothetical protein